MQNRYVGDLGDFGKYGLLRALCSRNGTNEGEPLTLGVVWYLVPDEGHNGDGKFVRYLEPSARNQELFRACDPDLYDALRDIVRSGGRNVSSIKNSGVLPVGTRYYESRLTFEGLYGPGLWMRGQRVQCRTRWLEDALALTSDCDLVFADPDNGLEVKVRPHQRLGLKYAFFAELVPFVKRGQSLVIYHHVARRGSALEQVRGRLAQIEDEVGCQSFALLYHRGSARTFFVAPAQRHRDVLFSKAEEFLQTPWARHFELVILE